MRQAFADAVRRSPSHPLVPAIKRALKQKSKSFGGWFVLNKRKRRGKRSR
jgi:hypothetical protein